MKDWLKELLTSKKALAMLSGLGTIAGGIAEGSIDGKTGVMLAVGTLASYVLGQGLADLGKNKPKSVADALGPQSAVRGGKK